MKFINRVFNLFRKKRLDELQHRALHEIFEMLSHSMKNQDRLRANGWERVLEPPLVGNQRLWKHPIWHFQLEKDAIIILNSE